MEINNQILEKIRRFIKLILETMDADALGNTLVAADLKYEELNAFLNIKNSWIYESPDGGKTIYRRRAGEDERELLLEDYFNEQGC